MLFRIAILEEIGSFLRNRGERAAVAESVTAGFLQLAFSQIPNASLVYKGGITAYTLEEKVRLLDVDPVLAKRTDCVSAEIASQMARCVARLFNAEWSIATTGYATPVPESGNKCFVFFSIYHRDKLVIDKRIDTDINAPQVDVQHFYVEKILQEWHACLALT